MPVSSQGEVEMANEKIEPESMEGARLLCHKVWDSYPEKRKAKTRLVKQSYKEYQKILNEKTTYLLGILRSGRGSKDEVFQKAMTDFNDTIKALEKGYAMANAWMELVENSSK